MSSKNNRNQVRSIPSLQKNGELALFYNMAYNRTSEFIRTIQKMDKASEFEEIRLIFFPKHSTGNQKEEITDNELSEKLNGLTERTYSELKVFIWNETKGKDIRFVTREEITELNHILLLLLRLRDYHSHYWHDDIGIKPTAIARGVLERHYNIALKTYQPQIPNAIDVSKLSLWDKKNSQKLSTSGVDFFLGCFLTMGQMELFMKSRKFLNRGGYQNPPKPKQDKEGKYIDGYLYDKEGNIKKHEDGTPRSETDILDLEKAKYVASFYSSRDTSESSAAFLDKLALFNLDAIQFHILSLENYLLTLPHYLHDNLKNENKDNYPIRIQDRPTKLLASTLAFLPKENIEWRIFDQEWQRKKLEHPEVNKEDLQKIADNYFKAKAVYVKDLNTETITTKRLNQETGEINDKTLSVLNEVFTVQDKSMFRVKVEENKYVNFIIGFENMKHWAALYAINRQNQANDSVNKFAKDFAKWIDTLNKGDKFTIETSFLQNFNGVIENNKVKYASILPSILLQLNNENNNKEKAFNILRQRILDNLKHILSEKDVANPIETNKKLINPSHFVAKVNQLKNTSTDYLIKEEIGNKIKEINRITNWIKQETATEENIRKKIRLENEIKNAKNTKERFEKVQVMLDSIEWILSKKARFHTSEEKNQLMKYCYLLDMQQWKQDNLSLIYNWLDRATTVTMDEERKKHDETKKTKGKEIDEHYSLNQIKLKNILTTEATSFDDAFVKITDLAIAEYKRVKDLVDNTYSDYEKHYGNLWGIARKLNVSNPSNEIVGNNSEYKKYETRREEILQPFCKKENGQTDYYINLPHDFFMIANKGEMKEITNINNPSNLFIKQMKEIKENWTKLNKHPNYQAYFKDFKEMNAKVKSDNKILNSFEALNNLSSQNPKEDLKKVKLLYQDVYLDTVLSLLKKQLENSDARTLSRWKKEEVGKLVKRKNNFIEIEIEGVKVKFTLKQLKNSDMYWDKREKGENRITKILKHHLIPQNSTKKEYTYEEIKVAIQSHWKDSILFISMLLRYEKIKGNKEDITMIKNSLKRELGYLNFEHFKNHIGNDYDRLIELRNNALHADVLKTTYKKLIEENNINLKG